METVFVDSPIQPFVRDEVNKQRMLPYTDIAVHCTPLWFILRECKDKEEGLGQTLNRCERIRRMARIAGCSEKPPRYAWWS